MSDPYLIWVEDEVGLHTLFSHVLATITGLNVIVYKSVKTFMSSNPVMLSKPMNGMVVLVTDGNLGDGTCLDVIEHAVQVYGAERLGKTVLVFSGDQRSTWHVALERSEELGLMPFFSDKVVKFTALQTWWNEIRTRFDR